MLSCPILDYLSTYGKINPQNSKTDNEKCLPTAVQRKDTYIMGAIVTLKKGEGRLLKSGGAWIFDNEVDTIVGSFENGDIVIVKDFDGYPLGKGFINTNSKIFIRMLTRHVDTEIDEAFFTNRLQDAWDYRKKTVDTSSDMYPLYWTTSKEGIFMRYSYEFKMMCVELYHSGSYPDIPEGLNPNTLKRHIREWSRLVDLHGPEVLKHKVFNKVWTPEEKLELISKVIAGTPRTKVAIEAGINAGLLYQWVRKYKLQGYNGLVESKKGRPTKEPRMKKSTNPLPLTESEREELIRLRTENEYIKAENEVIKKRIALRQEKWVAQLKAKKQQSSKNSEKKDIN